MCVAAAQCTTLHWHMHGQGPPSALYTIWLLLLLLLLLLLPLLLCVLCACL
jgi:hypothetical protein